ncbi:MAG TPA: KUP/HAK/KT family potassium transporter [Solirubrobacteraceae bacterium]|nr:KUP/HAK/KT family potassium transporter [Solirubrobacteraceae bacterium]
MADLGTSVDTRRARRRRVPAGSVLVAFDYRDYVPEVMATAARLAADHPRAIQVLITIPVPASAALTAEMPQEESRAESLLEEIHVQTGRRVHGHWEKVRARQAGQRIIEEARALGVGTVILPTAPSSRDDWNTTVEAVMRERPCRVIVESVPAAQRRRDEESRLNLSVAAGPAAVPARRETRPVVPVVRSASGAVLRPWENIPEAQTTPQADSAADGDDVVLHASKLVLALGALGVVYGDLGTSPLYTEQTIYSLHAAHRITPTNVYGITSLIFWSLTLIISFKYATLIMRAHNRGDGGGMALAQLIRRHKVPHMVALVTLGIIGASLFLGDGVITPAISVLSAVGGLSAVSPSFTHLVVPISLVILIGLFVIQKQGSALVGRLFGPIMLFWFIVLGVIGLTGVVSHPAVLQALSPSWGVEFFVNHGLDSFLTFGGVVLCVTGAEALYADRGHFGPGAIRLSWFAIVLPSVVLNYLGQSALVLQHPKDAGNPFFLAVPHWALVPLVILSTLATIIASQAVISGSYSVARQAMRLGYLPRLTVVHTSDFEGQIYIPVINWILAGGVIVLVLVFQSSSRLANAYGVAVTGTFVLDTALFLAVAHYIWRRPRWRLVGTAVLLWTVEVAFLLANLAKVLHGAWVPLVTAITLTGIMLIWNRGRRIVTANRAEREGPMAEFIQELAGADPPVARVPGVGIFMSPGRDTTPLAMRAALEFTHSLHEKVLIVSVVDAGIPRVQDEDRFLIEQIGPRALAIRHVWIRVGYQERMHVPPALKAARRDLRLERDLDLDHAAYFISQISVIPEAHSEMPGWQRKLFLTLTRNAASAADQLGLPPERTVSMGGQIPA